MKNYAKDGEVMYHTGLCREMSDHARIAVVPGDPGRVEGLARFFDTRKPVSLLHIGIIPPGWLM